MILLAPHSDDEALFATYIINRLKPEIWVVTDGTTHFKKFGILIEDRRDESKRFAELMGVPIKFLGIPEEELKYLELPDGEYITPMATSGNIHHDIVSKVPSMIHYGTYTKDSLLQETSMVVNPTKEELELKEKALVLYESQLRINPHHFEAVRGKPEYIML